LRSKRLWPRDAWLIEIVPHWSSPVAKANWSIGSWVALIQTLTLTSVPIAALTSSKSLKIRMVHHDQGSYRLSRDF
jgi:hypothetical protein